MEVTTRKSEWEVEDGRAVPFTELLVEGDKHTLSVRKYPKNISVKMWKNSDKSGTTVSLKMPHDMFSFWLDVPTIVENFDTELSSDTLEILGNRWDEALESDSF
jgi:hypothetical protein